MHTAHIREECERAEYHRKSVHQRASRRRSVEQIRRRFSISGVGEAARGFPAHLPVSRSIRISRTRKSASHRTLPAAQLRPTHAESTAQSIQSSRHHPQKYTHSSNSARPECETRRLTLPESPSKHTLPVLTAHRKPPSQRQSAARHRTPLHRGPTYSQMCRFDGTVCPNLRLRTASPVKNRHVLRGKYTA